jgi:hypothetical protein
MLKPIDFSIREGYIGAPRRRIRTEADETDPVADPVASIHLSPEECRVKVRMDGKCFNDFKILRSSKVSELMARIKSLPGMSDHPSILFKLFAGGQLLRDEIDLSLEQLGVDAASTLLVLCTDVETVQKIEDALQASGADRIRSLEEEEALEKVRCSTVSTSRSRPTRGAIQDWGFANIEPLRIDPMTAAPYEEPSSDEAQKLLERLASDRGIQAIMRKYHWRVGLLTELPPSVETGLMGLSDHCLLGLNKNKGEVRPPAQLQLAATHLPHHAFACRKFCCGCGHRTCADSGITTASARRWYASLCAGAPWFCETAPGTSQPTIAHGPPTRPRPARVRRCTS